MQEVIYQDRKIGFMLEGAVAPLFQPQITGLEALKILDDLSVDQKLHPQDHGMPWVSQLGALLKIHERRYISDQDLLAHILDQGYRNWTEIRETDRDLYVLAYRRGFIDRVEFAGDQVHLHGTERQIARMTGATTDDTALATWAYLIHTGRPVPTN